MSRGMSKKVKDRVGRIQAILKEYQGKLTVRQIFYQFVVRNWIPNNQKAYNRVEYAVKVGRIKGYIPWDRIYDPTIETYAKPTWPTPFSFKEDIIQKFRLDPWEDSIYNICIVAEKRAVNNILIPVVEKYRIPYTALGGYASISYLYELFSQAISNKKENIILYLGDHDGSGLNIYEVLADGRIGKEYKFKDWGWNVRRVCITKEQIEKFNLPPQRIKDEDSRSVKYKEKHGVDIWELDALPPEEMERVVVKVLKSYTDFDWEEFKQYEENEREKLVNKLGVD